MNNLPNPSTSQSIPLSNGIALSLDRIIILNRIVVIVIVINQNLPVPLIQHFQQGVHVKRIILPVLKPVRRRKLTLQGIQLYVLIFQSFQYHIVQGIIKVSRPRIYSNPR